MKVALAAAAALVFCVALVQFARARPRIESRFPRLDPRPQQRANLAHFRQGPLLRVSSVEWEIRHHPGYLVDGHARAILLEKWVSARSGDPEPWAEVELDRPADVDEVAMELAGTREPAGYTMRRYAVECFRGSAKVARVAVADNANPRPRHPIACPGVDRVRFTFFTEPGTPREVARVFEIEAWGR